MADTTKKTRFGFGSEINFEQAIADAKVNEYDFACFDEETIGWVDRDGKPVYAYKKKHEQMMQDASADAKAQVETAKAEITIAVDTKIGDIGEAESVADYVNKVVGTGGADVTAQIDQALAEAKAYTDKQLDDHADDSDYIVAYKPDGTIVDYRDKEIRVMCLADTEWALQQSGENADPNSYYIGLKAYAPSDDVVSFKEDLTEIIADPTMYYFEGNDFAGVDSDGRKYSIVWLPVAVLDPATQTWTYYGTSSSTERYIGWYYSVEWYNADGTIVATDCIRINLSNETCHSSIEPYYVTRAKGELDDKIDQAVQDANAYTDSVFAAFEVIEF